MKKISLLFLLMLFLQDGIMAQDADYPYTTATWNNDSLGNHRVVIHVSTKAPAVWIHIPWRRRDANPELKNIIVQDATTQQFISNAIVISNTKEYGDIIFEPQTVSGDYYVYYLPYKQKITPYLNTRYVAPVQTADNQWLLANKLNNRAQLNQQKFKQAVVKEFQSIDDFNSFYPMEVAATEKELNTLLKKNTGNFVLFPEDRFHPIRMINDIPLRWVRRGLLTSFSDKVMRNEYYSFQVGIMALERITDINIKFSPLTDSSGKEIFPETVFNCFNKSGVNWDATTLRKTIAVQKGKVQSLWCGFDVPSDIKPGKYQSSLTISTAAGISKTLLLHFEVINDYLTDRGDSDPKRHSRLRWLNSTRGQSDDIIAPYSPIIQRSNTFSILGREISIDSFGLPSEVSTFFNPTVTKITDKRKLVLASPFRFSVNTDNGLQEFLPRGVSYTKQLPGSVEWVATNVSTNFLLTIHGKIDCDGSVQYRMSLKALSDVKISDARLEIPYAKEASQYILGLGNRGGYRPVSINWKWDVLHRNQDAVWMGDINGGLYLQLHDDKYGRPLNTNFYLKHPLVLPSSWGNNQLGGILVRDTLNQVLLSAYSGARTMKKDDLEHFDFNLLITPFKTLDTDFQFTGRFYHKYSPVDTARTLGANIINVHHGNEINPYINYPFLRTAEMKSYIDEAHSKGMRVKIYNTVRELSYRCPEVFAIRSLGSEVFSDGAGGGHSWLQEHLECNYIPAWYCAETNDAAIVNSGMSRWHNYYVEDMKWLVDNVGIDGIYLDDIAYDRTTMRRVRRVLNSTEPHGLIDLHSCNQFNQKDGYINSALLYMDQFPYINRLWFGEEFQPNSPADFYLVELSGIPFGLMGEMLQDGGNQYYGAVYGMVARLPWAGQPGPIWKIWDEFGIKDSEMFGWWASDCPVMTNQPEVHASAFVKKGTAFIAVANWANVSKKITLTINWKSLGIDPAKATIVAPEIEKFQSQQSFKPADEIVIEPQKGLILIVK